MRKSSWVLAAWLGAAAITLIIAPGAASAQEAAAAKPEKFRLDIMGGLKGGLNGSWMTEVPQNPSGAGNDGQTKSYYPSFGLGGTVGLALDVRALGIVGLETGVHLSFDNAKGWNDINLNGVELTRINQEQSTTSMRVPLLVKLSSPDGTVKPVLGLGFEFVFQSDTTIDYTEEPKAGRLGDGELDRLNARNEIEASSYTLGVLSLGLEIDFGNLRMPIELRAMYNLGYGDGFEERVRVEGAGSETKYYYNGEYQGHFGLFLGLVYDYELWL